MILLRLFVAGDVEVHVWGQSNIPDDDAFPYGVRFLFLSLDTQQNVYAAE